ncbi:MAG TPA: hypothetical protein EYP43_03695, partial [Thermoplasmata archaeon]|nr:hypothetical protein [Thermoplasmata archaeon]
MRYWVLLLAASVLCMVLASGPDASADWPMFQGTLDHSGFYNGTLPRDNTTMWSYETGLWILSAPAYADGVVYAVGYDYHVHAIDARNGEVIWKTPLDWIIVLSSPAVDLDHNQLYVASLNKLYALNLTTGDIVWEFRNQKNFMETGWPEVGSPAVYNDHVYFGSVDGYLYKIPAIDPNGDGVMTLSEINSDGWYFRSGGVLPDSEGVFYTPVTVAVRPLDTDLVLAATALEGGTNPGKLYAVDDSDGSLVWSYEFGTQTPIINVTPIPGTGSHSGSGPSYDLNAGSNGIVWCPNGDKLYALDLSNGGEIYVKTANDWIMGQSPAWDEHNVYVGDDAGYLTAYDKETGAKAWELYLGGPIRTSPVYDAEGYMYTAWNDLTNRVGVVRCINLTNRITVWELPLEGYVISSFGIGDNVIYVGEADFNDPPFYSAIHSIGHGDLTVDLQVAQVMAKGLREGDAGHIVARIVNDGTTSAFDVKVRFYRGDPDAGGSLIGTAVMPRTRPGTSTPAVLEWAPTASGDLDIYVVVDPDNEIDEELEGNNKGSGTVSVVSGGTSPTSEIVSITPSDVVQDGKTVIHFVGSSDDPDGTVEAHRWTSNIDGFLYSGEEFNLSADQLSMGAHLIRYQVRDDDGLWSDNDTALLIVRPEADDDWLRSGHDVRNTGYSTSPTVPAATIEWSRPIGDSYDAGVIASPVVVDGITYYVDFNTTYALNATDGSLIWSYTDSVMYTQAATPAVDPVHGVIAVSGYNLTVLDLDDGSLIWRKTLGSYEFAGPLIDGDRLYIHSRGDVNITCFNLTTGAEMWNFKVAGGDLYSSPSIGFDRLFVTSYSTDDDNENYYALYALSLTDGTMDWRWRLGDGSIGGVGVPFFGAALSIASPTVFTYQGTDYVVVGDINGKVYAFDPDGEQPRDAIDSDGSGPDPFAGAADDGSPIWERALDEDLIASTSYHDGRIYVITWLGRLYCLDAT